MNDTRKQYQSSHIYQHLKIAHPDLIGKPGWENKFRFEMVEKHTSAFSHRLAEALLMKTSTAVIMNLKDEYSRCLIPDEPLSDREWKEGDPQRESALITYPARGKVEVKVGDKSVPNIPKKRPRATVTKFKKIKYKRKSKN